MYPECGVIAGRGFNENDEMQSDQFMVHVK